MLSKVTTMSEMMCSLEANDFRTVTAGVAAGSLGSSCDCSGPILSALTA